jgi:hypothetical protein
MRGKGRTLCDISGFWRTPNDSCWKKGPSLAYHESAAKKAYADVTAFLKDVFEQK